MFPGPAQALTLTPMRLAVFSLVDWTFGVVRDWADSAGHDIALLVTRPAKGPSPGLQDTSQAGPETVVMITPRVQVCEATLSELEVDLAVVFTFVRVPESIAKTPRYGSVNLHPSLLPAYRGANGLRSLYAGEPRLGATLHYLTPEFDAGAILAQASVATPVDVEPLSALTAQKQVARDCLVAGVPRALAGEPGEEQDASAATDAPRFSEEETILSPAVSAQVFQCRFSALTLAGMQPLVTVDDQRQPVRAVKRLNGLSGASSGIVSATARRAIIAVTDGVLELELGKQPF
jgi:methionyl-tRNA formyltransferase